MGCYSDKTEADIKSLVDVIEICICRSVFGGWIFAYIYSAGYQVIQ